MSITVSAVKARQNLGELLNIVSLRHEDVIIERAGKKIARLTAEMDDVVREPIAAYRTRKSAPEFSSKKKSDFSEFAGVWDEKEYERVMEVVRSGRKIDPELWK